MIPLLLALLACSVPVPTSDPAPTVAAEARYTCPMHPSVVADHPGSCPICGMTLVPVQEGVGVHLDEARRAELGVAVTAATIEELHPVLRLPAVVAWDREHLAEVSTRVAGWARQVAVAEVGERVRAGQALFWLDSPEVAVTASDLAAAERENSPDGSARASAARERLRRWGLPTVRDGLAAVSAPRSGVIVEASVLEGASVSPGTTLYRIADPARVWLEARLPEGRAVPDGADVRVETPGAPPRAGRVVRVDPTVDPTSRTRTLRIAADNADGALLPDAWATVLVTLPGGPRLVVPESAVLYTGPRRVVFVDAGEDGLVPREVEIGETAFGKVEIRDGLTEGEKVVSEGGFLVAADSRLREKAR